MNAENDNSRESQASAPAPAGRHKLFHLASVGLICLFGLSMIAHFDAPPNYESDPQNRKPGYKVSATELYREYTQNQLAANAKYKNKIVLVSGKITKLDYQISTGDNSYAKVTLDNHIIISIASCDTGISRYIKVGEQVKILGKVQPDCPANEITLYQGYYKQLPKPTPQEN